MSSNENWVRDQVLAAHKEIEQNRRRSAQYDANFKKASLRALDRIGTFFNREFGTQNIEELASLPAARTDAAFLRFSASFESEIDRIRKSEVGKRWLVIVAGLAIVVGGIYSFRISAIFLLIGPAIMFGGFMLIVKAFATFPRTPTALYGNQDLFLALRCQQIAEALRKRVNDKRADLGL